MSPSNSVLIVDDDAAIRDFIGAALGDAGYVVQEAANGAAALDLSERQPPAVILLDMRMPIMDGWEFIRHYRARLGPLAPIVVITAAHESAEGAVEIVADAHISKPFKLDKLLDLVARYVPGPASC